jgi:hypothetical protein
MKVAVFTPDTQEPMGIGEMHLEDLEVVDDDDETKVLYVLKDHPHILMEDGEIITGIECWWTTI